MKCMSYQFYKTKAVADGPVGPVLAGPTLRQDLIKWVWPHMVGVASHAC